MGRKGREAITLVLRSQTISSSLHAQEKKLNTNNSISYHDHGVVSLNSLEVSSDVMLVERSEPRRIRHEPRGVLHGELVAVRCELGAVSFLFFFGDSDVWIAPYSESQHHNSYNCQFVELTNTHDLFPKGFSISQKVDSKSRTAQRSANPLSQVIACLSRVNGASS